MKKLFTILALLSSCVVFSKSLYWTEPSDKATSSTVFAEKKASATTTVAAQAQSFSAMAKMYSGPTSNNMNVTSVSQFGPIIYGTSPFQDSIWGIDTATWQVVQRNAPSLPSFLITGINGMAVDPTTGICYVVMKVSSVSGRVLGTIDLSTGVCTQIGNLGHNFSSITFDNCGQLYGATGDGDSSNPETFYTIDKTTGVITLVFAMGNGVDGEIICYNKFDGMMYHWSGNGTVVYEKWPLSATTYTPTNIPTSGTVGGETFGALCNAPTDFIVSNIASHFKHCSTTGVYGSDLVNNPDDLRGIVMPVNFKLNSPTTFCQGSSVNMTGYGFQLYDSITYNWGDGNIQTFASALAANVNHTYNTAGTFTISMSTNSVCGISSNIATVPQTFTVTVNALPVVTVATSSGLTTLCPSGTQDLIGTSAMGTYQWYQDGVAIGSATNTTYTSGTAGVFNMITVDANGCSDSAAVGVTLTNVPNPTVALGGDATVCGGITLDAGNPGSTYAWSDATSMQTDMITVTGSYSVTVTDANGCVGSDAATITVNPNPVVNLGGDVTVCGGITLDAGNVGSTYTWNDATTAQMDAITTSGTYSVSVTDANGCVGSDAATITVNPNPTVALGGDVTVCGGITLDAGNVGSTYAWSDATTTQMDTITTSGTYSVTVTDGNGCTGSDAATVTVNANPTPNLGPDVTGCANTTLDAGAGYSVYAWSDATSTQTDMVTASGTYSVAVTDANGCIGSDTIDVTINPNPTVTATSSGMTPCLDDANLTLTGSPVGGTFSGPGVTGTSFDPSIGAGAQNVIYTYTDVNGCVGTASVTITVSACVGIAEQTTLSGFNVYPNPGSGVFNITLNEEPATVNVFDMNGQLIGTYQYNEGTHQIDGSAWAEGIYTVQAVTKTSVAQVRLVITK